MITEIPATGETMERLHCLEHTGIDGKLILLTWVCGIGMTANLMAISVIGGVLLGNQTTQSSAIAMLQTRQDANLMDVKQLKEQVIEIDRRLFEKSVR